MYFMPNSTVRFLSTKYTHLCDLTNIFLLFNVLYFFIPDRLWFQSDLYTKSSNQEFVEVCRTVGY